MHVYMHGETYIIKEICLPAISEKNEMDQIHKSLCQPIIKRNVVFDN